MKRLRPDEISAKLNDEHCDLCESMSTGLNAWWLDPNTVQGEAQIIRISQHIEETYPKPERRLLHLPYSEVCMHMKVAGTTMFGDLVSPTMVQLVDYEGHDFSFPITVGEAGWDQGIKVES